MASHLRELQERDRQSTGSAAKLLQANQLNHHSLGDGSEQSKTVWIFFMKRALEQIPLFAHKEGKHPLLRNQPWGTGEYPWGRVPRTTATAPQQGWEVAAASQQGSAPVSCSQWSLPPSCPHARGAGSWRDARGVGGAGTSPLACGTAPVGIGCA